MRIKKRESERESHKGNNLIGKTTGEKEVELVNEGTGGRECNIGFTEELKENPKEKARDKANIEAGE